MKKKAAIKHFGSGAAVARELNISRAAVSKWADIVPLRYIWKLQEKSGYKLALRLSDYRMEVVK